MDDVSPLFLAFEVRNIKTGKPVRFQINASGVKMPHGFNFDFPREKYHVEFTRSAIAGDPSFGGMNFYAARELGIPFEHGPEVVVVAMQTTGDPAMRGDKILCTIAHEILEAELMSTGLPYRIAHMYAMMYEKGLVQGAIDERDQF